VIALAAIALVLTAADRALACSVCFGDPNSQITKGVESGVWFLLGIIGLVQVGFVAFFVYLRRRARGFRDPMPRPVFRLVKG